MTPPPYEQVLSAGAIGTLTLPHRIVMGSMHLSIEDRDDGGVALAEFYAARARGGAGLIITGGSAVSRVGAAGRHYGFANEAATQQRLAHVVARVHAEGGVIALQLFHAGRYAREDDFGLTPVAPSAIASRFSRTPPRALNADEIDDTIADFASAAAAAREIGFNAIEIMGSEGYLLNQFCSPITNRRDDQWGGDTSRRQALPLAVLAAVREAIGRAFPVIYRMSGDDLMPGSTTPDETVAFAQALAAGGADALNIGVGWHESAVPTVQLLVPGGTWTPTAARIKEAVPGTPVITGNRLNRIAQAEEILTTGAADFVSMARPFLADPNIINASISGRAVNVCIGCDQACIDRSLVDERVSCLVNPRAGFESTPAGPVVSPPRRIAVIGGGPAGLAAARQLAARGQRVTVFEAAGELGGQFRLARMVPGKADYGATIEFYDAELARLGVETRLGEAITAGNAAALADFDAAVLATGVVPRPVDLPGASAEHVLTYPDAFAAAAAGQLSGSVAVIGAGGIGVDLAHVLTGAPHGSTTDPTIFRATHDVGGVIPAEGGRPRETGADATDALPAPTAVTLMRRSGKVGAGMGRTMRWAAVAELRRAGVEMRTGVRYRGIVLGGVEITPAVRDEQNSATTDGGVELIPGDTVVLAAGQVPHDTLTPTLTTLGLRFRVVGGARNTHRLDAVRAFSEGLAAADEMLREWAAEG